MSNNRRDKEIDWFLVFFAGIILGAIVGGTIVAYMIYGYLYELLYSCAWTQGYAFAWNMTGVIK